MNAPDLLVRMQVLLEEDLQLLLVVGELIRADSNKVDV